MQNFAPDRSLTILFLQRQFVTLSKFGCSLQCFGIQGGNMSVPVWDFFFRYWLLIVQISGGY